MFSMDNFGAWLLEELDKRELSQSQLAKMAGLSRGTLSNIISGTRGRGQDSIERIARALKLPPEHVFSISIGKDPNEGDDPWAEEMTHKLTLLSPGLRDMAERLINTMIEGEEAQDQRREKKARKNPAAAKG